MTIPHPHPHERDGTFTFVCAEHPLLSRWPDKSLITGACPKCGATGLYSDDIMARVLKAREIARWYRPGSMQTVEEE